MNNKQKLGIVGLGVMGSNLSLNISAHGYSISIYNRSSEKTNLLISKNYNKNIVPFFSIKDFVNSIEKPRKILLMVQAGQATDSTICSITPFLDIGDILIDAGNAFYKDTIRRYHDLSKQGFSFIGMGVSGGEEGALKGPSIMPGGEKKVYELISPILKDIAAKSDDKKPCVTYIGPDGSGHYVKMIHNGIEYGDMQLIAESYFLLKKSLGIKNKEIAEIFTKWNLSELNSYLIEITINILNKKDKNGEYLLDSILDEASNKGTGKWTIQDALDLGEPLSLITESVFARYISSLKSQRLLASKVLIGPELKKIKINQKNYFIENLRCALYFSKIISYAQGFSQLQVASNKNNWNLNYAKIAKIFRAGCIIRAKFLNDIIDTYKSNVKFNNLLLTPYFKSIANKYHFSLREIVSYAINNGIPVPALSSAISYYDSYRSEELPANLIQAQRDFFGSHTYKRKDQIGCFHTDWLN